MGFADTILQKLSFHFLVSLPQYKVYILWLSYMHKTQHCIGGGEGEVMTKTIWGE